MKTAVIPRLHILRDDFSHGLIGVKQRTLDAARHGQPIQPVAAQLQTLVFANIQQLAGELADQRRINPDELIVFEAGSFAKGSCNAGSDLDLNLVYPEQDFARLHGFESALIDALTTTLSLPKWAIHNNQLNLASQNKGFLATVDPQLLASRRIRRDIVMKIVQVLRSRGIFSVGGKDTLEWASWAAVREPAFYSAYNLFAVGRFMAGNPVFGFIHDSEYIFGNAAAFKDYRSRFQAAIDLVKLQQSLGKILMNLQRSPDIEKHPKLGNYSHCLDLDGAWLMAKRYGGHKVGLMLLSILAYAEASETGSVRHTYGDYLESPFYEKFFGQPLRDQLFWAIDYLLKLRAVIGIFANGDATTPGLAPQFPLANPAQTTAKVLDVFGYESFGELNQEVMAARGIIKQALAKAVEARYQR